MIENRFSSTIYVEINENTKQFMLLRFLNVFQTTQTQDWM